MSNKVTNLIAFILLAVMAGTAIFSMKNDSLTFDELAHIPAGYSYLTKMDYRINPEHPPLIKDIPALPLLFLGLNFPDNSPSWIQEEAPPWWFQFNLGDEFLYSSGNNPEQIIFWSRLAMLGLLIFTGWFLFYWAKKIGGNFVALGTLSLFAFSPTFLAHGRLVNTDVGAVFGALIAIFFWLKFLENPTKPNIFLAGIAFGIAMVLKFSLILLIPFFVIITIIYPILKNKNWKSIIIYAGKAFLAALIGLIFIIWPIYQFHIWNYPPEQQLRDTIADISGHPLPLLRDINLWMAQREIFRPFAQYMRGVLMASQRTMWGNTTFFKGEISADSWLGYFPLLYLLKIPLAFHFFTIFVLIGGAWRFWQILKNKSFFVIMRKNFILLAFCFWIAIYWAAALMGNLNIGLRHLLPAFPFIYILVMSGMVWSLSGLNKISPKLKKIAVSFVFLLFIWYIYSSILIFPHYLSYYNELAGGPKQGYKIAVDSNYDWGQDFYRLLSFIEKNEIEKIYIDYFGGANEEYYLKEKYVPWRGLRDPDELPKGSYLAVSATQLQGGRAEPVFGFDQPSGYYRWLDKYQPVARAGNSIFIYYID